MEKIKLTTDVAPDGNCPDPSESAPGIPAYSVEALISRQIAPAVKHIVDVLNTAINEKKAQ